VQPALTRGRQTRLERRLPRREEDGLRTLVGAGATVRTVPGLITGVLGVLTSTGWNDDR
jgi:hypothetical protein